MKCPNCQADNRDDSKFCSNCAAPLRQAEQDAASLTMTLEMPVGVLKSGTLVAGKYRIIEELGRGGMGVVYKAEDIRLQRTVALKFLRPGALGDGAARERLLREARTASKLSHPHVCTIYEVGESGEQTYVAMELVEGQTLSRKLEGAKLATGQVLRLGIQLAEALDHAHRRGVVHRDFKSANIVLTPEENVKVLDFGLAKRLGPIAGEHSFTLTQDSLTGPGAVVGALAYMAPEQLRGEAVDARSDVWALGVVLYEMASGVRPFQGKTSFDLTSSILNEPSPPLPERRGGKMMAALQTVVEKCLEKEPARRYQTAGEDKAIDVLEHCYQLRVSVLPWIRVHGGEYEPLFDEPRFQALVQKIGLPL